MTDKMREAIMQFGQDNPSLDLDFRLHTHGKYLTQEKAIVASRAFKAGAAWQAAQSVPVVGEPVAWLVGFDVFTDDEIAHLVTDRVPEPLYKAPTHSISAAELEWLREDAERYRWLRDKACNSLSVSRDDDHACNYVTAKEWIESLSPDEFSGCENSEVERMKESNTIWKLQIYPDTPIGFYVLYGATLDYVVDAAIAAEGEK